MLEATIYKPFHAVFQATLEILQKNGFFIKESSEASNYITANKKASFLSYGETVEVTFKKLTPISTTVSINSFSNGIQIIDWGVNSENEQLIKNQLVQRFK